MEEQQTTAGDQVLAPQDGLSMEDMPPVNSDKSPSASPTDAIRHASPSSLPVGKPRTRNSSWMVGWRKLRILVWKNFLLRKRSWVLLMFQFLYIFGFMIMCFDMRPPPPVDHNGPINSTETSQEDLESHFMASSHLKEILYVANDPAGHGHGIIESIKTNTSSQPANWTNVTSEKEVEAEFSKAYAGQRTGFWGAVIFEKVGRSGIEYKIRKSDDAANRSLDSEGFLAPFHTEAFLSPADSLEKGPRTCDGPSNPRGCEESYMKQYDDEGILGLQILIDDAAIKEFISKEGLKRKITMKSFPYPKYQTGNTYGYSLLFCLVFMLVFLISNAFLAKCIGSEKETGVKELMKLSGYPGWMQTLAWYLIAFLLDLILLSVFLLVLKGIEVFKNSDITLIIFTFLLVMMSNNAFVIFLCSLTKSTALATAAAILLPVVIIIPTAFVDFKRFSVVMAVSLLPHGGFVVALKLILAYEGDGRGAQWSMLTESRPSLPKLNLGLVIAMILVDIVLYQILAFYFEAILPSDYGIRKPPYYPIQALVSIAKFRKRSKNNASIKGDTVVVPTESKAKAFEPSTGIDKPVGVEVRKLVKKFGAHKTAVSGVSLKMYDGEIFALLGHNGAGKTTLISMLTGLLAPTSGTAIICGHDIRMDLDKVQQKLGFCPQHDMLFTNLTVMEHLQIFGQMKGQSSSQVKKEALDLLKKMNLSEKQNKVSKNLSGGQKRKLCLGMALIGGAKVVILDEPTSGMDPEARRAIWDLLLQVRDHRTILLTTHFMEEADALGERIGIMAAGQLECYGTPSFLKSFYGTGLTLKMAIFPGADKNAILALVQKHISTATLKPIIAPNELSFSLPTEATGSSDISALFSELTEKKKDMHIESLGLSVESMDDIFVKVGELSEKAAIESKETHHSTKSAKSKSSMHTQKEARDDSSQMPLEYATISQVPTVSHGEGDEVKSVRNAVPSKKTHGLMLILVQATAIFLKRCICTKRRIFLLLFQILIPTGMILGAVMSVKKNIDPGSVPPALTMSFKDYENSRTLYSGVQNAQKAIKGSEAKYATDIEKALKYAAKSDINFFREKMIVGGDIISEHEYTAWYNLIPLHAAPLAINLASNIRARELHPSFTIRMINHPLQTPGALKMQMAAKLASGGSNSVMYTLFLVMAFLLFPPFFVILPTQERLNNSRELQLNTGLNPLTYWTIYFLCDMFIVLIVATTGICIAFIFENYKIFSSYGGLGVMFLVIMTYGFAIIPLAYLISNIPKSVAGALIILILVLFIPLLVILILMLLPPSPSFGFFMFMNNIASLSGLRVAFTNMAVTFLKNARCNVLGKSELAIICSSATSASGLIALKKCCVNFKPDPYLTWTFIDNKNRKIPGIAQLLVGMFVTSLLCLVLHISLELGVWRFIRSLLAKDRKASEFVKPIYDEDIREEQNRVAAMIMTKTTSRDVLVVDTLCKRFGSFPAVAGLWFGVHNGECFGMLGTNGAGKTTTFLTFRMLTGGEEPSFGDVHQGRLTLKKNRRALVSQVGYCPQFDAFVPYFTGKENLQLFARLRGIPWKEVNKEADKLLESVGLTESGNVQCRKYSGGMKRRLSAAIALIGNPPLVLLDEPTSGVDPTSRRQFWKVLEAVKGSGQSIILTSHSMDECEALCARLGIMVNGQLQCLGGVQHLKHKYALGYSLTLRLKSKDENVDERLDALSNELDEKFHPCVLQDQHENTGVDWNVIFNGLEELKKSYGDIIEDYSVSETSLEDVFLHFARRQYAPREEISLCRRIFRNHFQCQ